MANSSLKEKTGEYFHNNPDDISIVESDLNYIQKLLKKGDELVHSIYEYYYKYYKKDEKNQYLNQYSSTSSEQMDTQNLKTAKKNFKSDEDNSGIFNYKVFVISNEVFTHNIIEDDTSQVGLLGDGN